MKRTTIIDFVEKYTREFSELTFLREKVNGVWTETSFRETREEAYRIGAGLYQLGLKKGDKVSLLSQGRNLWITSELGILYAGGVNVPLSIKLTESTDLLFRIQHSDSRYVIVSEQQLPKIRNIIADCPKVEKVIVLDPIADYQPNEMPISEVIAMGEMCLIADRVRIRPGGGNQEIEWLHTCVTRSLCHNVKELSVRLCMKLIKYNSVDVKAVLGVGFCRKHLVEAVCRYINNPLGGG